MCWRPDDDERMAGHYRLAAVRAHMWEMAGAGMRQVRLPEAARRTTSIPERRHSGHGPTGCATR
jgi:hypothetical protein